MQRLLPILLLLAACESTPKQEESEPLPDHIKEQEKGIAVERKTTKFDDREKVPEATEAEQSEFRRVWGYFAKNDPRWPLERDRFKRQSDAAAYMLTTAMMAYYMQLNFVRAKAARQLVNVKAEIVALGSPAAPYLVDLMIMDRIPFAGKDKQGKKKTLYFQPDDITRGDCDDMLTRMRGEAVPALLAALKRKDLGVKSRRLIALALGGTKDKRVFDPLVKLLREDPSWQVRADAARGLGRLGDYRAIGPLTDAVRKDKDSFVIKTAGKARYDLQKARARG